MGTIPAGRGRRATARHLTDPRNRSQSRLGLGAVVHRDSLFYIGKNAGFTFTTATLTKLQEGPNWVSFYKVFLKPPSPETYWFTIDPVVALLSLATAEMAAEEKTIQLTENIQRAIRYVPGWAKNPKHA